MIHIALKKSFKAIVLPVHANEFKASEMIVEIIVALRHGSLCGLICLLLILSLNEVAGADDGEVSKKVRELGSQAFACNAENQAQRAATLLEEAVQLDPNDWYCQLSLAQTYMKLNQTRLAFPHFQAAFNSDPSKPESVEGIARCYFQCQDFNHAAQYFSEYVKRFPDQASAYTYLDLGRALAESKRPKEALSMLMKAVQLKPMDPDVCYGEIFLLKSYGFPKQLVSACDEFLKKFPVDSRAEVVRRMMQSTSYQNTKKEFVDSALNQKTRRDDVEDFVIAKDPQHKEISPQAIAYVKEAIRSIPYSYRNALEEAGYKIVVTPELVDVLPNLSDEHPRGWEERATWHNANGTFYKYNEWVVVGERRNDLKTGQIAEDPTIERTARHEFGHAYDYFLGQFAKLQKMSESYDRFSSSAAFRQAYENDLPHIAESSKKRLAYFLQSDTVGQEELFAQMFPLLYGGAPMPGSPEELFASSFPSILKLMKANLDPNRLRIEDVYGSHVKNIGR
jgi:tetratricopeptide (TPR) repeat protein